jgi:hypothetical protein
MPDIAPSLKILWDQGGAPALTVDVALFVAYFTCNAQRASPSRCRFVEITKQHARTGASGGEAIVPRNNRVGAAVSDHCDNPSC